VEGEIFAFKGGTEIGQDQSPGGRVADEIEFGMLVVQLEMMEAGILRQCIAEGDAAVVGAGFDEHAAAGVLGIDNAEGDAVPEIVDMGGFAGDFIVVIDSGGGGRVGETDVRAQGCSACEAEAEARVLEERLAFEAE
jgi:hypothetical protein